MRLWLLTLACALLLAACGAGVLIAGERMPTAENDHLLDGIAPFGGPKKR